MTMGETAQTEIVVRNLTCSIEGKLVLDDVSFEVKQSEIFGVMGLSGAGKSTLLRNLIGLIRPQSGEILIEGTNILELDEYGLNEVRSRMGLCFQYAALFDSMTVFDNVAFGLRRRGLQRDEVCRLVQEHLEVVGLAGTESLMPASLSGGMRKRVGIARALVTGPEIMLYDEPTSGLDPILATSIDLLIADLRHRFGMTCVVVTHDVDHLFGYADRVLMLHNARVVECDTPEGLRRSGNPVIQQFVRGAVEGPIEVEVAPKGEELCPPKLR